MDKQYEERCFASLAHIIARALTAWPNPVEVKPDKTTASTLVVKLRWALRYKRLHPECKVDGFPEDRWQECGGKLSVYRRDGRIFVGPPGLHRASRLEGDSPTVEDPRRKPEIVFNAETKSDLLLFLSLYARGLFEGAEHALVRALWFDGNVKFELETQFGVLFVRSVEDPNVWEVYRS